MAHENAQIVGSVVAGISSTVLGHPLDTVKTHLQTNSNFSNSWDVVRRLRFGLFRGMVPPLANAIIMNSVMFSVFDAVDAKVKNPFIAGVVSGFATAIISTPTDFLKIQSQLQTEKSKPALPYTGLQHTHSSKTKNISRSIVYMRRSYRGFMLNLGREGIFTMVYLGIYHWVLKRARSGLSQDDMKNLNHVLFVATTSTLTGGLAWVASYPFDVAKTMVQSGRSMEDIRTLWNKPRSAGGGLAAFFRGCLPSTGRAMLVTSSRMIAYDQVLRYIDS